MYELIWVGENTYYIESPAKIGVYDLGDGKVCLIDSGSDKDVARKILHILGEKDWTLSMIICTHSHADHIGGNQYLQEKTGCVIYGAGADRAFMQHPMLEPSLLFGGCPPKMLRNKFLMAQPSTVLPLTPDVLPEGLRLIPLDGHAIAMSGIYTDDEIFFIADAVMSEAVLNKYPVSYLYDVQGYLKAIDTICATPARLYIPSHADATKDITPLAEVNRAKALDLIDLILQLCRAGMDFEGLLAKVFDHCGMSLNLEQYALTGSALRAYLSFLLDAGKLRMEFSDNRLFWRTVPRA